MALDSFATTHPIVQQVRTVEQANQAFDDITYEKGQSVISMLEGFAGENVWRDGIRAYMRKFAYRNTRTTDLWAAIEGAGAKGLVTVASDFTSKPGIPLIEVTGSSCVNGKTVATINQAQFSNDRKDAVAANPLSWHVPVRASVAGGAPALHITQGRTARMELPGCGLLLLNPGQTGYYRTLYSRPQADALLAAFATIGPVDQYGLLSDALALSNAGYQPMSRALDLLAAIPADSHQKVAAKGVSSWVALHGQLDSDPAAQQAIKALILRQYSPRLKALGFVPRANEAPLDTLLRQTLIGQLGAVGDPAVVAEGQRLFAAWQKDPNAIPGALKETWLGAIAANADAKTWDALHRIAGNTRGSVERTALYQLLGRAKDESLARRALELSLTREPGATISAGMIRSTATAHPGMALDFVLSHLPQVNPLVDISGRARFFAGLVANADDPALAARLDAYANANVAAEERRPVATAVGKIRWRVANAPRIRAEVAQWAKARPQR